MGIVYVLYFTQLGRNLQNETSDLITERAIHENGNPITRGLTDLVYES